MQDTVSIVVVPALLTCSQVLFCLFSAYCILVMCLCFRCALQLWTRSFGLAGQSVLIPLLDLANHAPNCKHYSSIESCGGSPSHALLSRLKDMAADDRAHIIQLMVVNEQQQSKSQQPAAADSTAACPDEATPGADASSSSCQSATPQTPISAPAMSPAPAGSLCMVWRAGEALQAGQPVCNGYKSVLLQDVALLHYGFLQVRYKPYHIIA